MRSHAGFTLLEVMLVLLLLSGIALLAVSTLPTASTRPEAEKLLVMMRWAAGQAQLDGAVMRLHLTPSQAELARLVPGRASGGPYPGQRWQPVSHRLARFHLPDSFSLSLWQQGASVALPATLLFMPDGDQPPFTLRISRPDLAPSDITGNEEGIELMESP